MSLAAVSKALEKALPRMRNPLVLGIGNEISADDGAGPMVASLLKGKTISMRVLDAGTVPENFVPKVVALAPSHLIVVDAATLPGRPGSVGLVSPGEVDSVTFMTHHIPLGRTLARILERHRCETIIIGIVPGSVETGEPMTPEVAASANAVVDLLIGIDRKLAANRSK